MLRNHREDTVHSLLEEKRKLQADPDESTHDHLISCFYSQAHCFAFLSVWTSISGAHHSEHEETTFLQETNTLRLGSELLEHVVLCGLSSHLRGHILRGGHLSHHWLATPKHWLNLFIWLLVYLIYRPVQHLPWIIACVLLNCCSVFFFPSSMCNTQKTSYPVFLFNFLLRFFR